MSAISYAELSFCPLQNCWYFLSKIIVIYKFWIVEDSSLPSPYISAGYSGFFKNLEKWERIENGLNKRFCYQDRRTERKVLPPPPPAPKSHVLIKRQKYTKYIRGTIFLTAICPVLRHLENVNIIPWRKVNENVSQIN